jgi:tellurite resistance protein
MVTAEEDDFYRRVLRRFDLPHESADRPPVSDPGRAATLLRELKPDVQARVMALLVEAAIVDGCVDPRERALLLVAAAALGIDATAVEERITRRLLRVEVG